MATKTGGSSCIWLAALHVAAAVIDAQPDSMARAANQASRESFPLIAQCRYRDLNTEPASIPRQDVRSIRLLGGDTTELKCLVEGARVRGCPAIGADSHDVGEHLGEHRLRHAYG